MLNVTRRMLDKLGPNYNPRMQPVHADAVAILEHHQLAVGILTMKCSCGHRCPTKHEYYEHVADIIITRQAALLQSMYEEIRPEMTVTDHGGMRCVVR